MLIFTMLCVLLILAINPTIVGAGAAMMIILLVWFGQREKQILNPYFLFLPTPISLILYSQTVSTVFLPKMNQEVQLVIILGIFSYLAGLLTLRTERKTSDSRRPRNYSFYAFLILGLFPHLIGIARTGIPLFASDVNIAREHYLAPLIGQLILFLPVSILIAFREGSRKKVIIALAANFAGAAFMVSKFSLFFCIIFLIFGFVRYQGDKILPIRAGALTIALLMVTPLVFEATFSARDSVSQSEYFWRNNVSFGIKILDDFGDYLYLPYMYLTAPWSNFAYIYDMTSHFDYGARSVYAIASFLQVESLLSFEPRGIRRMPFNTHAYLSDFYLDFGLAGVVALSYLLGLLVKWAYIRAAKSGDLLDEAIWITIGFASMMLFFSNHFTTLTYPLLSLIAFKSYQVFGRATKYVRRPHNRLA